MAKQRKHVEAVAYLRTSSATNVGADKDSDKRQRTAIKAFARSKGFTIVGEFYDAAVSGADPIDPKEPPQRAEPDRSAIVSAPVSREPPSSYYGIGRPARFD